jgi:hypothetical protein
MLAVEISTPGCRLGRRHVRRQEPVEQNMLAGLEPYLRQLNTIKYYESEM